MPKIYEVLGYPIDDERDFVKESRKKIYCPFISDKCDGGGNRYMSDIDLKEHPELQKLFPDFNRIPSGVCSIQLSDNTPPWIICPRRLLYMGRKAAKETLRGMAQTELFKYCGYEKGTEIGIWAEAKVKYLNSDAEDASAFDYTFDYVLMPIGRVSKTQAIKETGLSWNVLRDYLEASGHTFALRDGEFYIEDFPIGYPVIVEVMTSSTSGGNKKKRSCIPQAFEDCMLGKEHLAPGINYRQVWARMASQLIVKSQATIEWGGKTIWVLQDLLADYISSSTALDLKRFIAQHTDEVNILAFSYGNNYKKKSFEDSVPLDNAMLYAGPIRSEKNGEKNPCFQDIVLASVCPPRQVLLAALAKKEMSNRLIL